jgi:hypothetical protein
VGKFVDLTGQVFGRFIVVKEGGRSNAGKVLWLCKCSCGNEKIVVGSNLRSGNTKSCDCLRKEVTSQRRKGVPLTEECKRKLSVSLKGLFAGDKHPMFGKHLSEETKRKISVNHADFSGEKNPNWGKCFSEEIRTRMSLSRTGSKNHQYNPDREYIKVINKIRRVMKDSLRRTITNKSDTSCIVLGYTKEQLIQRLVSQFIDGMSWSNYGCKVGQWSVDHIKPISAFVKEEIDDPKIINALDNLCPMWHVDNMRKGNKYQGEILWCY